MENFKSFVRKVFWVLVVFMALCGVLGGIICSVILNDYFISICGVVAFVLLLPDMKDIVMHRIIGTGSAD